MFFVEIVLSHQLIRLMTRLVSGQRQPQKQRTGIAGIVSGPENGVHVRREFIRRMHHGSI